MVTVISTIRSTTTAPSRVSSFSGGTTPVLAHPLHGQCGALPRCHALRDANTCVRSAPVDESLEKALIDLEARAQAMRSELVAAGEINEAFHPRLEEINRFNTSRLRQIIAVFGWPGTSLVGEKGARAAWRVALYSYAEPEFMRQCRDLIDRASQNGDAPRWQFAMIDDRIRVYEGKPQRYGTQLRHGANGVEPHPLENAAHINSMRTQAGLPLLAQTLAQARAQPAPPPQVIAAREAAELEFRRHAGWITD